MSASTLRVSHDQRKKELVSELTIVMKATASHQRAIKETLPAEITANLCAVVEAILIHGLRDPFFLRGSRYAKYPEPNFWPFVSKFTHRSVCSQIAALNQIKTEIGRSRTWVRIVLNEGSLEHYLGALAAEKKAIGQFYTEEAFIRDGDQLERTKDMLKSLAAVAISAPTNSSLLNTWTPSPLILAGLVDGKPLRVASQPTQPRRLVGRGSDAVRRRSPEETGICALELLPSEQQQQLPAAAAATTSLRVPLSLSMAGDGTNVLASSPSPSSVLFARAGLQKPNPRGGGGEAAHADDASSVYSHPSMVDGGRMGGGGGGMRKSEGSSSESLVQRRTKRRRNMSRSSSDGSGSLRKAAAAAAAAAAPAAVPELAAPAALIEVAIPVEDSSSSRAAEAAAAAARQRKDSGVESEGNHASVCGHAGASSISEEPSEMKKEEEMEEEEEEERPEVTSRREQEEEEETMFEMSGDRRREEQEEEEEKESDASPSSGEVEDGEEDEEEEEEDEYVEEYEMASTSTAVQQQLQPVQPMQQQQLEADEGVASLLSGNSLMGRSWLAANRYPSSIADSQDAAAVAAADDKLLDESFEGGAEIAVPSPAAAAASGESLSTSPETDGSLPAPVSFGAALRQHVVQQAGGTDVLIRRRDFSDSTEEEEEEDEEMLMARQEAEESETVRRLTEIASEAGLDSQEFRCAMCKSTIGTPSYRAYSVCAMDARYYCGECWLQGAERVVPARMVTSWDTRVRKISPRARVFLDGVCDRPLVHIDQANPSLYDHSAPMREVKELREKLQLVSMYLLNCRESVAADLRRRLAPREYYIDDVHLYSYNDLLAVVGGSMARQLRILLKFTIGHVFDCGLCSQKGFHCEMCNQGAVIYPFQTDITHRCSECFTVSHTACYERTQTCVKCERRRKYSATRREATHLEIDC